MDRGNPYEAAFENYIKQQGLCYVGVDEKKRSCLGATPVKNLDFIVLGACGSRLLVDVKGRQFPGGSPPRERFVWESWSTQEDIDGMTSWMNLFGSSYLALFVFMYRIGPTVTFDAEPPDLWTWHDTRYLLRAVPVDDYRQHMRVRSQRWGTVGLPSPIFAKLARPFRYYSHEISQTEPAAHEEDQDRRVREIVGPRFAALAAGSAESWRGGD